MFRRPFVWTLVALAATRCGRSEAAGTTCTSAGCVNLVFDGDSISAGWGASPGHALQNLVPATLGADVQTHDVAAGGRPVVTCLQLYPRLIAPLFVPSTRHNIIAFHAGDNDIILGRDAPQIYAAFTDYVVAAHTQGWKVVVSTELRRPDFRRPQETELLEYNSMLIQNKAGADAVVNFDSDPRMTNMTDRLDPALFRHDGIHPSNGGYAVLAAMLVPAVKRVAGR